MGVRGGLVCVLLFGVFLGTFSTPRDFNQRKIILQDILKADDKIDCTADATVCKAFEVCEGDDEAKFCGCPKGKSGDDCAVIDWCVDNQVPCEGAGGTCEYDGVKGIGHCKCPVDGQMYDPKQTACKAPCSDTEVCQNKGTCAVGEEGADRFCECLKGTVGDKCEDIEWCTADNKARCSEAGGECLYDDVKFSGFCDCTSKEDFVFHDKESICKPICTEDEKCVNGGKCEGEEGKKICECLPGTSGETCEVIEFCTTNGDNCTKQGGECKYDIAKPKGYCDCKKEEDVKFDEKDGTCKKTCTEASDCQNDAACNGVDDKFCECKNETSGDMCETNEWCVANEKTCTDGGAECKYDPVAESGFCECSDKNKKFIVELEQCRETCSVDDDCANGAPCRGTEDKVCQCPKGTSGDKCATVDWCTIANKALCAKGGATCQYDATKEIGACKCADEKLKFDTKTNSCRAECQANADCQNNAKCEKNHCSCKTGTRGDKCETIDWCEKNVAFCTKAGGDCIYDDDKSSGVCKCKNDTFDYDEENKTCSDPCVINNPCKNEGKCEVKDRKATCKCKKPYGGETCENSPCNPKNPCQHEGMCTVTEDGFECACNKNYAGDECEKECKPGCGDFMVCQIESEEPTCQCEKGYDFKGDQCVEINICKEEPDTCGEYGVCENLGKGEHKCNCNDTYTGKECNEHYCDSDPCQNGGECVDEAKTFRCNCTNGYVGTTCDKHSFCETDEPCGSAECVVTADDDAQTGYCQCPEVNQYFDYTEKKCKNVDLCLAVSCNEDKTCEAGTCVCKKGYKTEEDGKCTVSFCKSSTCGDSSLSCSEVEGMPGLVQCRCAAATQFFFNGKCAEARCFLKDKPINVTCRCPLPMKWNKETEECEYPDEKVRCVKDCGLGWCKKEKDNDTCVCGHYFKTDPANGKCILFADKICASGLGLVADGSKCNCSGKYEMAANGITCERKTMCADKNIQEECTKAKGRCVDKWSTADGYECICDNGYVKINGVCSDPCSQDSEKIRCRRDDQICAVDENNKPVCRCPMTFESTTIGKCDAVAKYSYILENIHIKKEKYITQGFVNRIKLNQDIILAMKQMYTNLAHTYLTDSPLEGDAFNCKVELQFKSEPSNVEGRIKKQVKRRLNCTSCDEAVLVLPPALIISGDVEDVTKTKIDLCTPLITEKLCGPGADCKDLKCFCKDGYKKSDIGFKPIGVATIQRCEAIDQCAEGASCPANSECQNKVPDFFCKCKKGYRKEGTTVYQDQPENAAKCVGICDLKPCKHGSCNTTGDQFDCTCAAGFTGSLCDKPDRNFLKASKNTTVVGAVLGTILGIVLIIFFVTVRRLRKNNYSEDFSAPSSHQMEMNDGEMMERRQLRGISNKGYQ